MGDRDDGRPLFPKDPVGTWLTAGFSRDVKREAVPSSVRIERFGFRMLKLALLGNSAVSVKEQNLTRLTEE